MAKHRGLWRLHNVLHEDTASSYSLDHRSIQQHHMCYGQNMVYGYGHPTIMRNSLPWGVNTVNTYCLWANEHPFFMGKQTML